MPHHPRNDLLDWLKGWAILAVVLDHTKAIAEPFVVWSVNIFVLVTATTYSVPGYVFTFKKLALKIFQLLYLILAALFFSKILNALAGRYPSQPLFSILTNPYRFFVANTYLGDIWYIALHLQFLFIFFACFRAEVFSKPKTVLAVSAGISALSILLTRFVFGQFHTILFTSWVFYLAVGYYGMAPLLQKIESTSHGRGLRLFLAFGALMSFYALYPIFPWAFTNDYRASFFTLPFYFALIVFLAELFHLSKKTSLISLLGRHTLAIYLTHEAFAELWRKVLFSPFVIAGLSILCGMGFGIAADLFFAFLKKSAERPNLPIIAGMLLGHRRRR